MKAFYPNMTLPVGSRAEDVLKRFAAWIKSTAGPDKICYWVGHLARDRVTLEWRPSQDGLMEAVFLPVPEVAALADVVWAAKERGLVELFQRRSPDGFEYFAYRKELAGVWSPKPRQKNVSGAEERVAA